MKKTRVISLNSSAIFSDLRENRIIISLTGVILVGIFCGVLLSGRNGLFSGFSRVIFEKLCLSGFGKPFFDLFATSFVFSFVFVLISFLTGTSFFGIAFIPVIVFFRGVIYGLLSGYIYRGYALNGIVYNALILVPGSVFSIFIMLLCCSESVNFSSRIGQSLLSAGQTTDLCNFRKYCIRYGILLLFIIIASLFDAIMSVVFLNFFNFE